MQIVQKRVVALGLAVLALPAAAVSAAAYPDKPVRLIVPAGAGSANDTLVRMIALKLSETFQRTMVVDNRPGAGGIIGVETAAHAAADGYTLLTVSTASVVILPQMHKKLNFDVFRDFAPIAVIGMTQNVMVAHPAAPATVRDLIIAAKSNPDRLNMASAGLGSQSHLAGVQFLLLAGIDVVHVPYKDGGASVTALIANQAQFTITPLPATLPHVRAGRLRAIATGGDTRAAQLPEVPTMVEAGVAGYQSTGWNGLLAPVKVSRSIVQQIASAVARVIAQPEMRDQFERQGAEARSTTPVEFASFMREEWDRYAKVIKAAGITPQ
ncbi:MAG: tripartite tricarboxylate transporter substrate binding protein [Betaproteobacteria bacterium]